MLALGALAGCTAVQFTNKYIEAPGVVRVHIASVDTYEKRRWLLDASIENVGDQQVIVQLRDITCHRGDRQGALEYRNPFGIGERSIDLKPGETKALEVKCLYSKTEDPPEGRQYRLRVARVFADRTGDGSALGEVLARDLEWSYEAPD